MAQPNKFVVAQNGVTSLEYALLASLIAVVCAVSVSVVGISTRKLFVSLGNAVAMTTAVLPARRSRRKHAF
jgi:Flp pilus assembly pilin Flp